MAGFQCFDTTQHLAKSRNTLFLPIYYKEFRKQKTTISDGLIVNGLLSHSYTHL